MKCLTFLLVLLLTGCAAPTKSVCWLSVHGECVVQPEIHNG